MRKIVILECLILGLLFVSCANLENTCRDGFIKKGMTAEEADTGAGQCVRIDTCETEDDWPVRNEEGTTYTIDYNRYDVEKRMQKMQDSVEKIDSFVESLKKIGGFEVAVDRLEKQKEMTEWRVNRYKMVHFYRKFLVDNLKVEDTVTKHPKFESDVYLLCPLVDLKSILVFEAPYVLKAKKSKQEFETIEEFEFSLTVSVKKDNPDYPDKDRTEQYIWEDEKIKGIFLTYDINDDKISDFIEGYRFDENGNKENYPLIRVFHDNGDNYMFVTLVDRDRPADGIPEEFIRSRVIGDVGSYFFTQKKSWLAAVFSGEDEEEEEEDFGKEDPVNVWIARPGDVGKVDIIEKNEKGWLGPINDYDFGSNFKVALKYKKPEETDEESEKAEKKGVSVDWLALSFKLKSSLYVDCQDRTVEFYRVREVYRDVLFEKIVLNDDYSVELYKADGTYQKTLLRYFIERKSSKDKSPFRIDFDRDKDHRVTIWDEDGDGVLESKKTLTRPDNIELDADVEQGSASSASTGSGSDYGH